MSIKIFISHRHADKEIADVLRKHLTFWEIPSKEIFQSSSSGGAAPGKGRYLTQQLIEAVQQSKLAILIYTFEEADWSYAMWEVGLAEGDASTNVVVIQCSKVDVPKLFRDRVHVKLELEDMRTFVKQFHTKEGFFPGQPAYKPKLEADVLEQRSKDLYDALVEVVPGGRAEQRYRWDFLTLEISADGVEELRKGNDSQARATIESKSVAKKAFGQALKHFGYDNLEDDLFFSQLIRRWKAANPKESDEWIRELSVEIRMAANNKPTQCHWKKMKSVFYPDWYFYPILNHVRIHPDGRMHLDVYLYRMA